MIEIDRYNKLKEKYGHTSSWTIWKEEDSTPKSNTGDMSVFNDDNLCSILHDDYVFVGLNGSSTHGTQENISWKNFHSDYSGQNDFKLRYALKDTNFWGCYITDVIKDYFEVDSEKVMKYLKDNPDIISKNIEILRNELEILSDKKPVLIAIGNDSYNILNRYLKEEYKILKIMHYSNWISKENYRQKVLEVLKNV